MCCLSTRKVGELMIQWRRSGPSHTLPYVSPVIQRGPLANAALLLCKCHDLYSNWFATTVCEPHFPERNPFVSVPAAGCWSEICIKIWNRDDDTVFFLSHFDIVIPCHAMGSRQSLKGVAPFIATLPLVCNRMGTLPLRGGRMGPPCDW